MAHARVSGVHALQQCRDEVNAALTRWSRQAPVLSDRVALIRVHSATQIHPLLAARWVSRLRPRIVLVANDGYLPDRVNFAMRCADPSVDLIAYLRSLAIGDIGTGEYARNTRATGGSLRAPTLIACCG